MKSRRKLILTLSMLALGVVVAAGVSFAVHTSIKEQEAEEQRVARLRVERQVWSDLQYAECFAFTSDQSISLLITKTIHDPSRFNRVDFYRERPQDFVGSDNNEGVITVYPSDRSLERLARFNNAIIRSNIDLSVYGFASEITLDDLVNRREDVKPIVAQALFDP